MTTTPDSYDAATASLMADPEAHADRLVAESDAASMAPEGLAGSELADYVEAMDLAAGFIAQVVRTPVLPVADALGNPSRGTLAYLVASPSERMRVKVAAATLANLCHAHHKVGSGRQAVKVYEHRIARIALTLEEQATPDLIAYLIELSPTSPLRRYGITEEGTPDNVAALVAYPVTRTYEMTDRETGEILTLADEGQYRSDELWQSASIVELCQQQRADDLAYDMSWNEDGEHNVQWSFGAIRRLTLAAARRNSRETTDEAPAADPFAQPF
jgi:hypothetical protein